VRRAWWRSWITWALLLIVTTLLLLAVRERLDKAHIALVFLLVVLGASAAAGRAAGLGVSGVAFLAFNYLFLPPYYTLVIADPLDWLVLVAFLITGVVAAQLLYQARSNTEMALARAREVDRLATLGAETLAAPSATDALSAIATVIRASLDAGQVELYRRDEGGGIQRTTVVGAPPPDGEPPQALGVWFGDRVHVAVLLPDGTTRLDPDTVSGLEMRAIVRRLDVRDQPVGVLRVSYPKPRSLTADSARLLDALAYYAALGVERVRLEAHAEQAEAQRRMESLRSALLMAVSHDLRTPLTTIKALAHELTIAAPTTAARIIEDEADRLDALVGDLLDLSRLQAGAVQPVLTINTVDELIGAALQRAHGRLGTRAVAVTLPDDLLLARYDLTTSLRILVNLLENAAKYSPPGTGIEIVASRVGSHVALDVTDEGPGVPLGEEERVFEPFFRPAGTPPDVRGTGLGLSIARGLAESQGGSLRYRRGASGGATFVLTLPGAEGPAEP
jgi:two-component system, OmpR family, sensor histidine kinase KdpD